ncbi:MAG: right-handed parallel beta-helix repeat-containing protein [Planctomycetota bacterium]
MSSTIGRSFMLAAGLVCGLVPHASADVITVDDDLADLPTADFTLLQDAIDAAVSGDEIVIYPGTYEEDLAVNGKVLTIRSTDPSDPAIVDATDIEPSDITFGFRVGESNPASTVVTLQGLKFTRFNGNSRAGVRGFAGSTLIVEDCIFTGFGDFPIGTVGSNSGGIRFDGNGRASRCAFINNESIGVLITSTSDGIVIEDCTFTGGRFSNIDLEGAIDTTIRRSTFGPSARNEAQPAIVVSSSDGTQISDCTFIDCVSSTTGSATDGGRSDPVL